MAHFHPWRAAASALAAAALLAACGGGDSSPITTRIVSFGDSLSDVGSYTPATSLTATPGAAPYFGGKFTTNTHTEYALAAAGTTRAANSSTASTWVEWVASRLGVAITPHEVGFGPQSVKCPVATSLPALAGSCTGYGQGGSRVTDPNGIGKSSGALTVPIVVQMDNHLTRFTGYSNTDIVFVYGGNNDILVLFTAVGGGQLTPAAAVSAAQLAGTQLATAVKDKILAKGATRVAVMNLPDTASTPAFAALPAANKAVLSQLSAEFNTSLVTGLAGTSAQIVDARALTGSLYNSPGSFGFTNVTTTACDPAKIAQVTGGRVTDGSSLFCNAAAGVPFNGLRTGASTTSWLFADSVHPTTGGHKAFADQIITVLKNLDWMPANQ